MATQSELANELRSLNTTIKKVSGETTQLLAKVDTLQAALEAGSGTTPEVDEALADIRASIEAVDSLVADAPTTDPTGGTEGTEGAST